MLKEHDVPYIHMREFDAKIGPFERFKTDRDATDALMAAISATILESGINGSGAGVPLADLERYNAKYRADAPLKPYSLCLYVVCAQATDWGRIGVPWQVIVDRVPKAHRKLAEVDRLLDSDRSLKLLSKAAGYTRPSFTAISKNGPGAKDIPALQAADFLAWEIHRSIFLKLPWFQAMTPFLAQQSPDVLSASLINYQAAAKKVSIVTKENEWEVRERRSIAKLLETGATRYRVLDFNGLEVLRDCRRGVRLPIELARV